MRHIVEIKPFIKYAGGKTKLLPEILPWVPASMERYHEPFVGGGAVFAAIAEIRIYEPLATSLHPPPFHADLNDSNIELMNAYTVLRSTTFARTLMQHLTRHQQLHSKKHYYATRKLEPKAPIARAARFIYLNKTCFNGLYRVNAKGGFNVPMGSYKKPEIFNEKLLRRWHKYLQRAQVHCEDFAYAIDRACSNKDFVYCDPPYLSNSDTADFTSYTKDGFTLHDHERLHASLVRADKRGVKWLLSEGDSRFIRTMFHGFRIIAVDVQHSVSASAKSRTKRKELLITNM